MVRRSLIATNIVVSVMFLVVNGRNMILINPQSFLAVTRLRAIRARSKQMTDIIYLLEGFTQWK